MGAITPQALPRSPGRGFSVATEERSGSGVDHVGDVTDMIHQREGSSCDHRELSRIPCLLGSGQRGRGHHVVDANKRGRHFRRVLLRGQANGYWFPDSGESTRGIGQRLSGNFSRFWEKVGHPVLDSPIHRFWGIALLNRRFWRINQRGDCALIIASFGEKSSSGVTSDVAPQPDRPTQDLVKLSNHPPPCDLDDVRGHNRPKPTAARAYPFWSHRHEQ